MARIARQLEQDTSARFAIYADDITVWTEGHDFSSTEEMITELQAAASSLEQNLPRLGLEVAPEKSELLLVYGTKSSPNIEQGVIYIGNTAIPATCGHVRLLGLPLGSHNSPRIWLTQLKQKWKPMLHLIRRLSNKYGGAQQRSCLTMARAVAIGMLTYGAPVYDLNKTHNKFLNVLHRATLRAITGLPRHTKIEALERATTLPPIDLIMTETRSQAVFKRSITRQGLALMDWDAQCPPQEHSLTIPIAPWATPYAPPDTPQKSIPRNRPLLRSRRLQKLSSTRLPGELDVYTDASVTDHSIGLAWHCPELTDLNGSTTLLTNNPTPLEAELHAVIGALNHISFDIEQTPPTMLRILTDSFGVIQELRRPLSLNPLVHEILSHIGTLRQNGISIRIDWVPGHESACTGNLAAHTAAQESLRTSPPLVDPVAPSTPTTPSLQLIRYKHEKKLRYKEATPPGYLHGLAPLPRVAEIFVNKITANAAYTPHIIHKWIAPTLPSKCTFCSMSCYADLRHLLWHCSTFSEFRQGIDPLTYEHIATPSGYQTMDRTILHTIAIQSIKSGLAQAV